MAFTSLAPLRPLTPRLRMLGGPNCSRTSTIKAQADEGVWGPFINADNIKAEVIHTRRFNFDSWNVDASSEEMRAFFESYRDLRD